MSEPTRSEVGLTRVVRRHPIISATLIGCAVAGAALGGLYLPPEWSLLRRCTAGGFGGAGAALLITATKMIG